MVADVAHGEQQVFRQLLLHLERPVVDRGWTAGAGCYVRTRQEAAVVVAGIFIGRRSKGGHTVVDLERWIEAIGAGGVGIRAVASDHASAEIAIH